MLECVLFNFRKTVGECARVARERSTGGQSVRGCGIYADGPGMGSLHLSTLIK